MVFSSNPVMWIKVVLMSMGVLAMALFLKISVPLAIDHLVTSSPIMWSSFLAWLRPPYLYFVINGIIITIAASSRFHQNIYDEKDSVIGRAGRIPTEQISVDPVPYFSYETVKDLPRGLDTVEPAEEKREEVEEEEKNVLAESRGLVEDGGDEYQHETLENTWKMIMKGKSTPLTGHGRRLNEEASAFRKSGTSRERTNHRPPPLSQEELNRRVEGFIKKFNKDMRLQRLESLKHFKEII